VGDGGERGEAGPSVPGRGAGAKGGLPEGAGGCDIEGGGKNVSLTTTVAGAADSSTLIRGREDGACHGSEGRSGPPPFEREAPPKHSKSTEECTPQLGGGRGGAGCPAGGCEVLDLTEVVATWEEEGDSPARKKAKSTQILPEVNSRSEGSFAREPPPLQGLEGIADEGVPAESISSLSNAQAHGDVGKKCTPGGGSTSSLFLNFIKKKPTRLLVSMHRSSHGQNPQAAPEGAAPRQRESISLGEPSSFRDAVASSQDMVRSFQGVGASFGRDQGGLREAARLEGARQMQASVEAGQAVAPNGSASPSWDTAIGKLRNKSDKLSKVTVLQTEPTVKLKIELLLVGGFWMPEVTHNAPNLRSAAEGVLVRYVFMHCICKKLGLSQDREFMKSGSKHFYGHFFPSQVVTEWNDIMTKDLKEIFKAFNCSGSQYYLGTVLTDKYRSDGSKLVERNPRNPTETQPDLLAFALQKKEWNLVNTLYRCTSLYKDYVFKPSRNAGRARRTVTNELRDIFRKIKEVNSSIRSLGQR